MGVIKSAGVEIRDVRSTLVSVRKELQQDFDLESYIFVPFISDEVCKNILLCHVDVFRLLTIV